MGFTLSDILHEAGQMILTPCLIVLVLFVIASIWQVGTLLIELLMEHRKLNENIPSLLQKIHTGKSEDLRILVENARLLKRHKDAILKIIDNGDMPKESKLVYARTLLQQEEGNLEKNTRVTDLIVKLGPMFGLLGTLIPLGPGIVALGQGDTELLSMSMAIAFDTTIAGVICAAVCYVISRTRKRWYEDYMNSMEAIIESIL